MRFRKFLLGLLTFFSVVAVAEAQVVYLKCQQTQQNVSFNDTYTLYVTIDYGAGTVSQYSEAGGRFTEPESFAAKITEKQVVWSKAQDNAMAAGEYIYTIDRYTGSLLMEKRFTRRDPHVFPYPYLGPCEKTEAPQRKF